MWSGPTQLPALCVKLFPLFRLNFWRPLFLPVFVNTLGGMQGSVIIFHIHCQVPILIKVVVVKVKGMELVMLVVMVVVLAVVVVVTVVASEVIRRGGDVF